MRRLITAIKRYKLTWLRADLRNGTAQYLRWQAETRARIAALALELEPEHDEAHNPNALAAGEPGA